MPRLSRKLLFLLSSIAGGSFLLMFHASSALPSSDLLTSVQKQVMPALRTLATERGAALGRPIYLRLFKESRELEVWMSPEGQSKWKLLKTFPIHTWGGGSLGPKLAEGDRQAPEGFYEVEAKQMNPNSNYHLSFNIGYPNAFDRAHHRTGSAIMVHGAKVSIGCFAMTDPGIEEIYVLAHEALAGGQKKFPVHIFPFRMTPERMAGAEGDANLPFWKMLQPAYDSFEKTHSPPVISITGTAYKVGK